VLDTLCRKIDVLDPKTIDSIGQRAKELNKELDMIVTRMYAMKEVDYDKNKIDFLVSVQ
jgi:hypothetical protein